MNIDWQTAAVALIILAACVYVGQRVFARLRSFVRGRSGGAAGDCATGCGKCGDAPQAATKPAPLFVQISPARTPPRHTSSRRS